jgi:Ser/Thr protein kinase RdoA (MazF antagonist)
LDFTDRGLSFERGWEVPAEQELPTSYVASHLWRDRIYAWLATQSEQMSAQPIHGDMHWGNVVATDDGFGFIDFDKVMCAPPVFDLAKLMATGMFRTGERTRFQVRKATQLLEGYESVRVLSPAELVALEGLAVLLNEQTALLGARYDVEQYRTAADAVAAWWIARRRRSPTDPLGIRAARKPASERDEPAPEPLWPDAEER